MASGEFDDDESAEIRKAYADRLESISDRLPAPVRALTKLPLHDGIIEYVVWEPVVKRLRMSLVTPYSLGYRDVTLIYSGALLGTRRIQTIRDAARDRETQILASEVDCDKEGLFSHRLLFWPRDEVTIEFADLELETARRQDDRVSLKSYFAEIFPEDSD